jgi:hypothetical protein
MRRVARCVCEKIAQNVAQLIFLSKLIHNIYLGKSGVKMWANSEIFKNLTKANNPTLGANSPQYGHPAPPPHLTSFHHRNRSSLRLEGECIYACRTIKSAKIHRVNP